ncbi:MAG: hypothetical protein O7F12_17420 [Nitrospirae bacterium]|nr:hypothetical protein [Nitrospirota bacterium]
MVKAKSIKAKPKVKVVAKKVAPAKKKAPPQPKSEKSKVAKPKAAKTGSRVAKQKTQSSFLVPPVVAPPSRKKGQEFDDAGGDSFDPVVTDDLVDSIPEDFGDEEEVADEVDEDMTEDLSEELGTEKYFRESEPRLEEDDDIMRSW